MAKLIGQYSVAVKRLAAVDADLTVSNQHEITAVAAFREVLGEASRTWEAVPWLILRDAGDHAFEEHYMTWYDSRAAVPTRSAEWRLYFDGDTEVGPGDLLALLVQGGDVSAVISAPSGSTWDSQLAEILGEPADAHGLYVNVDLAEVPDSHLEVTLDLFSLLGWDESPGQEVEGPSVEEAIAEFGLTFPPTGDLSAFVRDHTDVNLGDPDTVITTWWQAEEALFRGLERVLIEPQVLSGFTDVDEFLEFSLSVQNRRKSRAGHAFEHHLAALFTAAGLVFSRGKKTEGNRKPDFIFPGIDQYRDPAFSTAALTMLGVKTTCKDRWRQVLTEAARIEMKHLCTLEPSISAAQFTEMGEEKLTLVAPAAIIQTYAPLSGISPMSVAEFMALARHRQDASGPWDGKT